MASAVADRGGRFLWTDQATLKVLNLIRELDVVHVLKSKRQRNQQTFMTIEELLSPLGYDWSWQQIRCHWKNLKSRYNHKRLESSCRVGVRLFGSCKRSRVEPRELGWVGSTDLPRERRNLRPGQKSSWKYYNVMDSLLKQQTRAEDLASGRGDDSENSSGAENSAGKHLRETTISFHFNAIDPALRVRRAHATREPSQHGSDEYIVPTVQEPDTGSAGTAIMQHLGASASVEPKTVGADTVLVKKEVETDEEAQCEELHGAAVNGSCECVDLQPTASTVHVIPSVDRSFGPAPDRTTELQQIEQILSEPDIAPAMNSQDSACAESQSSSIGRSTDVRTRTSRRYFFTTGTPGLAEKKTRLELDILAATKRKLLAEQMKAEAEQRKAVAETLLLTEALKKCDEEKKKAMAETMFLVQERIRSEEETRRAAAMAAFHIEEKRKAAAEAEMLNEHKKYFMEQRKTEVIKRRMLLLELQKMRRDLKLVP
ncbi:hypothetical protein HPB52_015932 [Rhipicephalus sanguineus]|uniref:Myb/SANT-like DNA-binding domain-containing protein n=1 Tax=Rhipicephalus sanguineus TaxID=34632 RepID=A0A9D4PQ85_RHISA|nr:hypothetical protein HPB52_015932 [Rhipicephalus sanguineus]